MSFINWSEIDTPEEIIAVGAIFVGAVVGYMGYFFGMIRGNTIKNYKETLNSQDVRLKSLEEETRLCTDNYHESIKKINYLQGQLDTYKNTPIKDTSDSLKLIVESQQSLVASQKEIVKLLKKG